MMQGANNYYVDFDIYEYLQTFKLSLSTSNGITSNIFIVTKVKAWQKEEGHEHIFFWNLCL
jgi:hypothetical protein